MPLYRMAQQCRALGYIESYRGVIAAAFALDHDTPEKLYNRGCARIMLGDWHGWTDLEARYLNASDLSRYAQELRFRHAAWDGRVSLTDKVLLAYMQMGNGEGIAMLRFLPTLIERARTVLVVACSELVDLVRHTVGRSAIVVREGAPLPMPFDRYAWSTSFPSLIGELPPFTSMSAPNPLLHPCKIANPQIGICWPDERGSHDDGRSMHLASLMSLVEEHQDVDWTNLQNPLTPPTDRPLTVQQSDAPLQSFVDIANVIATLDTVVTTDGVIAHLAGTLGIRTFLLLDTTAHWWWGLESGTPWYPSMRILRQSHPGSWQEVWTQLADELVSAHRS